MGFLFAIILAIVLFALAMIFLYGLYLYVTSPVRKYIYDNADAMISMENTLRNQPTPPPNLITENPQNTPQNTPQNPPNVLPNSPNCFTTPLSPPPPNPYPYSDTPPIPD